MKALLTPFLLALTLSATAQLRPEYFRSNLTGDTLLGITERQSINAGIAYLLAAETYPALLKSAKTEAGEWKERYQDEVFAHAFTARGYTLQLEATEATVAALRLKARKGRRRGLLVGLGLGAVGAVIIPKLITK